MRLSILQRLFDSIIGLVNYRPHVGGSGTFDAVPAYTASNYDAQTGISFEKQLFMEARTRTIIGALSRDGAGGGAITDMYSGSGPSLEGSNVIKKINFSDTNMITMTMSEHMKGLPTYGAAQHPAGDPLSFKNMRAFVNLINAPTCPILDEGALLRIKQSITGLNGTLQKQEVLDWMAEEMEIQFLYSLIYGASPSILQAGSDCNLSLGINAGAGAGVPLMPRWYFDGQAGFPTYSLTPGTWNSTVNSAINTIGTNSGAVISLADLLVIRNKMDVEKFWPITFDGKKFKAIGLCDSEVWHRIKVLLNNPGFVYAMPRGEDNPYFGVDEYINYNGFCLLSVPNVNKLRPTYNSGSGYISGVADFGPSMAIDHRDFTTSSAIGLILFVTRQAAVEGNNGSIKTGVQGGKNDKGGEVWARTNLGYVRSEWYVKDGRATSTDYSLVRNYSMMLGAWYEPGIGSGTGY
jgi:hypothetical protein